MKGLSDESGKPHVEGTRHHMRNKGDKIGMATELAPGTGGRDWDTFLNSHYDI